MEKDFFKSFVHIFSILCDQTLSLCRICIVETNRKHYGTNTTSDTDLWVYSLPETKNCFIGSVSMTRDI